MSLASDYALQIQIIRALGYAQGVLMHSHPEASKKVSEDLDDIMCAFSGYIDNSEEE
jgi:hypothetical protein